MAGQPTAMASYPAAFAAPTSPQGKTSACAPAAAAPAADAGQMSLGDLGAVQAAERLRRVDVNTLTPIEAMNLVYELKQML